MSESAKTYSTEQDYTKKKKKTTLSAIQKCLKTIASLTFVKSTLNGYNIGQTTLLVISTHPPSVARSEATIRLVNIKLKAEKHIIEFEAILHSYSY